MDDGCRIQEAPIFPNFPLINGWRFPGLALGELRVGLEYMGHMACCARFQLTPMTNRPTITV
jgi:hypothetical protein